MRAAFSYDPGVLLLTRGTSVYLPRQFNLAFDRTSLERALATIGWRPIVHESE
jgi:hypothetical protein